MIDCTEQRRIKVVHFVECWLPQTETWLYGHINFLPEEVESSVVCQWTQNLDQFPAKHLFSVEKPPSQVSVFNRIRRRLGWWDDRERHLVLLENVIQKVKPQVLHSHFGHYGWINSRLAQKYNLPHVVSFYGFDVEYLPKGDRRWFSKYRRMNDRVDLVLCEGPHMAGRIADLGIAEKKITVFRLGIDLDKIPFKPREYPTGRTLRFLIAGSFREKKGFPYALEALGLFSQKNPNIEVTVVGESAGAEREQREKREILNRIERCGLLGRTRLLGYQHHDILVQEYYRNDIFLSPSVTASDGDTEGGAPVTIIEAAASGMPVVSTTHCDIPFVLSEANRPYLVPERDAFALSRAIEALVSRENWRPIVAANRQLIEQELSVKTQGLRLARIYRGLRATLCDGGKM